MITKTDTNKNLRKSHYKNNTTTTNMEGLARQHSTTC